MRSILVDWLCDVNLKFKFQPQSFFLTVNLIDRYLAKKQIKRQYLQLLGTASQFAIGKFEEIYPPSLRKYIKICDGAYEEGDIIDMEANLLHALDFQLTSMTSW